MRKIVVKNTANSGDDLLFQKVNFMANQFFNGFSPTECQVMSQLIRVGENGMLNLSIDTSKSITKALNLSNNTLNVSLSRIEKKGAIRKEGRIIVFQPVWNNIMNENEYLIEFKQFEISPKTGIEDPAQHRL